MGTIPRSVTEAQFEMHIRPYLRVAKRGYVSKIPLWRIFNAILYPLHTGCQWAQLPVAWSGGNTPKKRSAGVRSTITAAP
jgi:transposase